MSNQILITTLQIAASVMRLLAFAFAVLAIGRAAGGDRIILLIGYLPYFAFFDILVQSASRALHLHGNTTRGRPALRTAFAGAGLSILVLCYAIGIYSAPWRLALLWGAWPLGALAYCWERHIAQLDRQFLLAITEIFLLACCVACYFIGGRTWPVLLLCMVSFPVARLIVLAFPGEPTSHLKGVGKVIAALNSNDQIPTARRQIGRYIGSSLAQQMTASTSSSLPSIYAQCSGDVKHLAINVAIFRSISSFAAVFSLAINSIGSRIFYQQTGPKINKFEVAILHRSIFLVGIVAMLGVSAVAAAIAYPDCPGIFGALLLPAMALINAESSLVYNRGYPGGTLHCQIMVFLLFLSLLLLMVHHRVASIATLAGFLLYVIIVAPKVLAKHRKILGAVAL